MNQYLDKLDYGAMDVDSNTVDNFWLRGSSRITSLQQIDFLKRLYTAELLISERTQKIMKNLMVIEKSDQYKLSGKSGLSNENQNYNGWFIGYIERGADIYFFATNIEPKKEFDFDTFIKKRRKVTLMALKRMKIIH